MIARRRLLGSGLLGSGLLLSGRAALGQAPSGPAILPDYPVVRPGLALNFPADHGAHPAFRNEWWYVTGWLKTASGRDLGFQVTFFRTRPAIDERDPSAFTPRQIIFAHAALSDPALGRLLHDQKIARAGFGLAGAAMGDADVVLGDWRFRRAPSGAFHARTAGPDFGLDLDLQPTQPVMLQGDHGYSRKGPQPQQASYYYSVPHVRLSGVLTRGQRREEVLGEAWLDREWSSSYLDSKAVGWDWVGLNLDDGAALMAFQIRDADGAALWAGGSLRNADGLQTAFAPGEVRFRTLRRWTSPRTGAAYPVERVVELKMSQGWRSFAVRPLFDDQELDSRAAGGPIYWEGAARTEGGRGYLELTGYAARLRL